MYKFAVAAAVLVACGGSKDQPPKSDPEPAEPPKPAVTPDKPAPAPPPVPITNALGSCTVTVTGAAAATITSPGGVSRATTSYWFADGDKSNLTFPDGRIGLVIACEDPSGGVVIQTGPKVSKDSVPFGPKKYTLEKSLAGGELHALGHIGKTSLMHPVGTVDITAFDTKHIAGTFQFTATTLPGKGEAKVEGKFDYLCARLSGCAK